MSLILLTPLEPENPALHPSLENIRKIMVSEFLAEELSSQNCTIYQTFLQISQSRVQLAWRFEPIAANANVKVYIRPRLSDGLSGHFRAQTQRNFVDILRVISSCNRDKNKTMNFIISEFRFIELSTIFAAAHVADYANLRKIIKSTIAQLPEAVVRLASFLQPFLEDRNKPIKSSWQATAQLFLERSAKLLRVARFNQIKNEQWAKNETYNMMADSQIEHKMEQERTQSHHKLKDFFRILGFSDPYLKDEIKSVAKLYQEWLLQQKIQPSNKEKQVRNVIGIKILQQDRVTIQRNLQGSHCKLILGNFKVILMISINKETITAFQQMKNQQGGKLISGSMIKVQKQLELVKKVVKNQQKKQSKNSFDNEMQFILYIKDRGFKYLSTYYWQYDKKRCEMDRIIMNYYPHNLREMLKSQGPSLCFRQKLSLIRRITSAVDWLVSNYVCHRDIKPDNIMLDEHRVPKLIDFGSCCPVNGVGSSHFKVKQIRLLGSPHYYHPFKEDMCPIYKRNQYEQHLLFDAYSLGKVMRDIFADGLPNLLPNMQSLMVYMIERCEEQNPAHRLTYQQMLFLFDNFIQYLDWLQESRK